LEVESALPPDFLARCQKLANSTPAASAPKARAASTILFRAAECAANPSRWDPARRTALTAYDAVIEGEPPHPLDEAANRAAWRQPSVQAEIGRQFALLHRVSTMPRIYPGAVEALKRENRSEKAGLDHFMHAVTLCSPDQLPAAAEAMAKAVQNKAGSQDLANVMGSMLNAPTGRDPADTMRSLSELAKGSEFPAVRAMADTMASFAEGFAKLMSSPEPVADPRLETVQAHCAHLKKTMAKWEPPRVIAFVALLSEQWLAEYAAEDKTANAGPLRQAVDAAWGHLLDRPLGDSDRTRLRRRVRDEAPEDLDSPRACAACEIVDLLLQCCGGKNLVKHAVEAADAACQFLAIEAEQGDEGSGEENVQSELARQTKLLETVGALASLDRESIEKLRKNAMT
jgi:hypothetical protein